ncbi:MAG: protein-L-isoaspartate(D-aspartate) O-methyltransferase [Acidobacteriota bacterium]
MDTSRPTLALAVTAMMACAPMGDAGQAAGPQTYDAARRAMVADQIEGRGVRDPRVLAAMREVPRHLFVPAGEQRDAYHDYPLPIGYNQTISQPYIVALMTELARPVPSDRALEVGTGSGYQAAVLATLVDRVFTIELVEPLATAARERLARLGYANVDVRQGDGYAGWPEEAPFDVILVTAAPESVPEALVGQLKPGGRMVIPVGPVSDVQDLILIEKDGTGRTTSRSVIPVRFVPLIKR